MRILYMEVKTTHIYIWKEKPNFNDNVYLYISNLSKGKTTATMTILLFYSIVLTYFLFIYL